MSSSSQSESSKISTSEARGSEMAKSNGAALPYTTPEAQDNISQLSSNLVENNTDTRITLQILLTRSKLSIEGIFMRSELWGQTLEAVHRHRKRPTTSQNDLCDALLMQCSIFRYCRCRFLFREAAWPMFVVFGLPNPLSSNLSMRLQRSGGCVEQNSSNWAKCVAVKRFALISYSSFLSKYTKNRINYLYPYNKFDQYNS